MGEPPSARLLKALFKYAPQNTDELAFNKGDVITLTQALDGGWWEGTLKDHTGWFPSNYVTEIKADVGAAPKTTREESNVEYHKMVLKSLIDTERTLVSDLQLFIKQYVRPLSSANILSSSEFNFLAGNLEEIYLLHQHLLTQLEECAKLPIRDQRVGGMFLKQAPQTQNLYKTYCSNHPKAVQVLHKHKSELGTFAESFGAPSPGIKALTTGLSEPFTRLDKYSNLLTELQRHTDASHPDRGDIQRAIAVYKDITEICMETRRQKELESEILHSTIKGWEGQEMTLFGEVLLLSHVIVHAQNGEKKERLFLLFPSLLLMLSVSPRNSGYYYEGKLPVGGMTTNQLDDTETSSNRFEITGKMIDRLIVSCTTTQEQKTWVETLRKQAKLNPAPIASKPQTLKVSCTQPSIRQLSSQPKTARLLSRTATSPTTTYTVWSLSCLRPCPPARPTFLAKDDSNRSPRLGRKILGPYRKKAERAFSDIDENFYHKRIDDVKAQEDDSLIMQVVEAYCTSAKARHTVNSSVFDTPSVIIAEEEKIIIEEQRNGEIVIEERTLVDTVYHLRDLVKELKNEYQVLRKDFEDERRARKKLEMIVRKNIKSVSVDGSFSVIDDGLQSSM